MADNGSNMGFPVRNKRQLLIQAKLLWESGFVKNQKLSLLWSSWQMVSTLVKINQRLCKRAKVQQRRHRYSQDCKNLGKRNLTELIAGGRRGRSGWDGCRTSHSWSQLQQEETTFKGRMIRIVCLFRLLPKTPKRLKQVEEAFKSEWS